MPFINSKISVALSEDQEQEIKSRLGQAITAIPGKVGELAYGWL